MTYPDALKHLEQARFFPVYLLTGEEPFFIHQLLSRFREKVLDEAARDFNYDQFQGEGVDPAQATMIAKTFPVFSPRRLVIIQNAELIKDEREIFLNYLDAPCETTVLLFVAAKPDLRKKLFAALKKKGTTIHCAPLSEQALPGWILQEGKKRGIDFSEEATWCLKEHVGNDLFLIQQEIDKLALHLTEGKKIPLEMVQQLIAGGRSHSIFELTRALGEKDLKRSLALLSSLLAEGEHPLFILTMLTRQWRLMAVAREALDAGKSEGAVGKKVPMPPNLLPSFFKQLRNWKGGDIRRAFDLSLAADSQLKGGRQLPAQVLEMLMLDLCRPLATSQRTGYTLPFLESRP
ncbi:MAG: DNA polymerase III subunit delta [Candidatus Manganitrophaceae bacterium]|nr:MAG: DNA polymerase III subunit delta [Candidatus Manganitrophaceae bacterium]